MEVEDLAVDLGEEVDELRAGVRGAQFGDHRAGSDLQRCEQVPVGIPVGGFRTAGKGDPLVRCSCGGGSSSGAGEPGALSVRLQGVT